MAGREAESGAIVNVGSMSGFVVNRPQPQSYYNASKAAVHQLTKSLAAVGEFAAAPEVASRLVRPAVIPVRRVLPRHRREEVFP